MLKSTWFSMLLALGFLGNVGCGSADLSETKGAPSKVSASASSSDLPAYIKAKSGPKDVIVQLFNYPFTKITAEMPKLAEMGYAQIHVSPPNLTMDSDQWWGRYQPVDYRRIAGPLGNEKEFKQMIASAHRHKIKIIVDIVFNHTANEISPLPKDAKELVDAYGPLFSPSAYNSPFCITDYNDAYQVRNGRLCGGNGDRGLPDLNQNSPEVLEVQRRFLTDLVNYGVDGFRFDAIKHMEPDYFDRLFANDILKGKFVFGEVIADAGTYDRDLAPYVGKMSLYDFPLRKTLQDAFGFYGSLDELEPTRMQNSKGALPWDKSIGFIINHDIPNNAGFRGWILDEKSEELAYVFLLGRAQGVPYIYSDLGTKGGAGLIDDRWDHAHRSEALGRMITFHNYVHGEGELMIAADQCTYVMRRGDKGLFAINKCNDDQVVDIEQVFADSKAYDLVSRSEVEVGTSVTIPGRSYRLLVHP